MPTYRKRAKNKRIYPEDPIYNNKSYRIDWKIIGKNIARRRVELNYTQQNLSDITGIPSVTISQFERNNYGKHPNPHQLVILMHALKMDANALYDGILESEPLSKTEKALNELMKNINAEIAKSELYQSALENDRRHTLKPLTVNKYKNDGPNTKVADTNKTGYNQSNMEIPITNENNTPS
ncbi:MAG: helix-turn-helix transcriptional regulator [Oribacterium sp.]|nr:helix-turn-helix transcriptional regulator [Oribacterium sp.]